MKRQDKPATTYQVQGTKMKKKNIIIENEAFAISFLKKVQYYRLSGYWLSYFEDREKDILKPGITFEKISSIYLFDKELRNMLLSMLDTIETEFKSNLAYDFSHNCGPLSYKDVNNFRRPEYYAKWLNKFYNSISYSDTNRELYIEWYKNEYNGKFPFWIVVELCNFNDISKFYSNLHIKVKKNVVKIYGYDAEYIQSWLHTVVLIRNICAHNGRLYNRTITVSPKLPKGTVRLNVKRIFIVVYIFKFLCIDQREWEDFVNKIEKLIQKYQDSIELEMIGFPEMWQEILTDECTSETSK
ncbi:TPA: Abi family protein [Listeria monocytogenes]|nr:Abi family protein [Listeria monocytogenes]